MKRFSTNALRIQERFGISSFFDFIPVLYNNKDTSYSFSTFLSAMDMSMLLERKAKTLRDVQHIINYQCYNTTFLWEALQAAGTQVDCTGRPTPADGNKRLAVVGDAALQLALMEDWYYTGLVKGWSCTGS